MTIQELIEENNRRRERFGVGQKYDPVSGEGALGERVEAVGPDGRKYLIPRTMTADDGYSAARHNETAWKRLRVRHDFEYWGATCVVIKDKVSCRDVPFVLNRPQRRVVALLEQDRVAGRPLRLIMLKARQWGGSTLVQMYMAWIQLVHRRNWNSLICAHVKDTSVTIRGMYERLIEDYPAELCDTEGGPLAFRPFGRSQNTRVINGRGCRVTVASAERQDAVRGADYAMAHLSETAFWPNTPQRSPRDLIRAVCGAIAYEPYTLIVMESTANGIGNYFHSEWERCSADRGDKRAVFVPWYEIEIYRRPVAEGEMLALYESLDSYELMLWNMGLTLEMIMWYRLKRREYPDEQMMHAEYPTTADEAFINTGAGVFDAAKIMELRRGCREPLLRGDVSRRTGLPVADAKGGLSVWEHPREDENYVVSVDIGGRAPGADWSVICVMAAGVGGEDGVPVPRVVAQWRGHTDHDLLADKAVAVARHYGGALLVVESNTLEQEAGGADESLSVLARIARGYGNVYTRKAVDTLSGRTTRRVGFHTNRRTKPLLVSTLVAHVRELSYVERDAGACAELSTYTRTPKGVYEARQGCHDDMLMTRALALYVLSENAPSILPADELEGLSGQESYL